MSNRKAVLITGTSSGIGRDAAGYLAGKGWRVFAGVRRDADAERIGAESGGAITPVNCDVTNETSLIAAREIMESDLDGCGLDGLVNNAGIATAGPLEFLSAEDLRHQFNVNVAGAMNTTRTFLPLLRKAGGRIVNISSISGLIAFPFLGAYAMSKHALEAASDALRIELMNSAIYVSLIEPGVIKTPIWKKSTAASLEMKKAMPTEALELYGASLDKFVANIARLNRYATSPATVSRKIHHALTSNRPRARYLIGLDAKLEYWGRVLLPARLFDRILHRIML